MKKADKSSSDGTAADSDSTVQDLHVCQPIAKPNVGRSLSYEALGVIIKTKENKYYQVALNQEMCDCLFTDLKNYFKGGVVKILPNEITGISFERGE